MWRIAVRDLEYRRRRFAISILAVALVFGLTLSLSGLFASFDAEAAVTVKAIPADWYVTAGDSTGPFVGAAPMPATVEAEVAVLPGVTGVSPVLFRSMTVQNEKRQMVGVFGVVPGKAGDPTNITEGARMSGTGQLVADTRLGQHPGDQLILGGQSFTVSGLVDGSTSFGGEPNVYITYPDMQRTGFGGAPIVSALAVEGTPQNLPPKFHMWNSQEAQTDLVRPLKSAQDTILFVAILLWIIAVAIIGSIVYLSAVERTRDFAVFKATGVKNLTILGSLAAQAAAVAVAAAVFGTVMSFGLAKAFPIPITIPVPSILALPALAVASAVLASLGGARRAVRTDPALAFA